MNPKISITVDARNKAVAALTGMVTVGAKVDVEIRGIDPSKIPCWRDGDDFTGKSLRFRILDQYGRDLVRFPLEKKTSLKIPGGDVWTVRPDGSLVTQNGLQISPVVNFNTCHLRNEFVGVGFDDRICFGVVIDSVVDDAEYAVGRISVGQWATCPTENPTTLPDWRETLRRLDGIKTAGDVVAIKEAVETSAGMAMSAASRAEESVQKYPYVDATTRHWMVWSSAGGKFVDTGVTAKGDRGDDGITPHIGDNGHWFVGTSDTGVAAQGPKGEKGDRGEKGPPGETVEIDDTVTETSANPVKSSGVWAWVKSLLPSWLTASTEEPRGRTDNEAHADSYDEISGPYDWNYKGDVKAGSTYTIDFNAPLPNIDFILFEDDEYFGAYAFPGPGSPHELTFTNGSRTIVAYKYKVAYVNDNFTTFKFVNDFVSALKSLFVPNSGSPSWTWSNATSSQLFRYGDVDAMTGALIGKFGGKLYKTENSARTWDFIINPYASGVTLQDDLDAMSQSINAKRDLTNNVCTESSFTNWVAHDPPSGVTFTRNQPGYSEDFGGWLWTDDDSTTWYASGSLEEKRAVFSNGGGTVFFAATRDRLATKDRTFVTDDVAARAVECGTGAAKQTVSVENGVAKLDDFFSESNSLLTGRVNTLIDAKVGDVNAVLAAALDGSEVA